MGCDATFKFVPHIFGTNTKQHWTIFILCGENFLPAIQVRSYLILFVSQLVIVDILILIVNILFYSNWPLLPVTQHGCMFFVVYTLLPCEHWDYYSTTSQACKDTLWPCEH